MSFNFSFTYEKELSLPQDAETVLAFLKQYPKAIPPYFPGLRHFEEQNPLTYLWEFEPLNYGGKELIISFSTFFKESERGIHIQPSRSLSETKLCGQWATLPASKGCQLKMHFDLEFSVPLPKIMKTVVAPLASLELSKLFDRYAKNIQQHFE